ncbi:MAG: type II toxin-antitoxin system Phd/YefM family antitoxin [Magnetococcales bacterium]|nr:type II toxin-antitoxin system Phd/YefM family antitoxin [Magnetococcales bacterium]
MIRLTLSEFKTHLSSHLKQLPPGEIILLTKHGQPIAEVHPLPHLPKGKRPIGLAKGEFEVTSAFFDPLPDDLTCRFNGGEELFNKK